MKRLFLIIALLFLPACLHAQGARFDSSVTQQGTIGAVTNAVIVPANAVVAFCNFPANATPCTNKATTYTDITLGSSCSTSTQIVLVATNSCVASPDSQGNWGVWVLPGQYTYTITLPTGVNLGPFFLTLPGSGSGANQTIAATVGCLFAAPVTTWACTTNFNDKNVQVTLQDAGGNIIQAPTVIATNAVTTTFSLAQAGLLVASHSINVSIALTQPNAIVSNPLGAQQICCQSLTLSNTAPLIANGGISTSPKINSIVWLDGVINTTLAGCYAAIPSAGGVCEVPPNYSETLAANLVLSKSNAGFHFNGPATITMGTFQVTQAGNIHGAFVRGTSPMAGTPGSDGARFNYTGTSDAFSIGVASSASVGFEASNITVAPGASGSAFHLTDVQNYRLDRVTITGTGVGSTAIGVLLDGTSNFTGDGIILDARILSVKFGIQFNGSGLNAGNANVVLMPIIGFLATGGACIDFEASSTGNTVIGLDCESQPTGVLFNGSSNSNAVSIWHSGNTTDASFGASSTGNSITFLGPTSQTPIISDSGTNNSVFFPLRYKMDANGNYTITGVLKSAGLVSAGTAANFAGSTGACATISTQTGGAFSGSAKCTGTTGASTLVITPGITAPSGFSCSAFDETTRANLFQQTAHNTTTCTLTATSITQNDVFVFTVNYAF